MSAEFDSGRESGSGACARADAEPSGYLHGGYAGALVELGEPWRLGHSRGWALRRKIPGTSLADAMGCYPLLVCEEWQSLAADLENSAGSLVSFAAVIDPLGPVSDRALREAFPDVLRKFKTHFVVNLRASAYRARDHHERKTRIALRRVDIDVVADPRELVGTWVALYEELVRRRGIRGPQAFSRESLALQLRVPGISAIRAVRNGETIGMTLWAAHQNRVYYHLGALNAAGYAASATYPMFRAAITHFQTLGFELLDLGGGAGVDASGGDGLTRFKEGWATGTCAAFFGGRVLDRDAYALLTKSPQLTTYFPAYRTGEFG